MPGALPGKGGITRGPGPAALQLNNRTEGATDAFESKVLPRGRSPSREWSIVGLARSEPEAKPERAGGTGQAGATGGGAVSWQRRLAPRHRDVVRKFFTARGR